MGTGANTALATAKRRIIEKLRLHDALGGNRFVGHGDFVRELDISSDLCGEALASLLVEGRLERHDGNGFDLFSLKEVRNLEPLLEKVQRIPTGKEDADNYHEAILELLGELFFDVLTHPMKEDRIHHGRKRIDISFTNSADRGFFEWLSRNYRAPYILIECKNYESEVKNPDLDQLSGRFSRNRGQFGLLVCRRIDDMHSLLERCRDTAFDGRGFIIPVEDGDFLRMVADRNGPDWADYSLLKERFDKLVR